MPTYPRPLTSRLPEVGTTIFSVMSALAQQHGALNLSQGFPDFDAPAELLARGGAYAEALAPGKSVRVALNQTMSDESALLVEGAEVGFFPPVTGG